MAEREAARQDKPRRKKRSDPPMASMSDALRPNMENRKKLAETQKKDADRTHWILPASTPRARFVSITVTSNA